ncbi:multidrug effflux MFS transporter [Campylobacter avium]|uniref:multidrug effflux MFS transporter n=1 Tax=Campylobacter avium TaxID=522485 RepID=UPI0023541721|nr:multidrug effflux MFS transporter [Campylobacter avium]
MQEKTKIKGFEKFKLVFILALMSSIAPISTDMYLPALETVERSFATNTYLTQLSLASFFVGFALGQLIYGPLSDVFGRKKPVIIGMILFISASIACILVDDIRLFILLRFVEALGGCAGVVIARAIVNDLFELKEAISVFALMMVVSSLAPMLSPVFGGILLEFFSWQSIFVTLFLVGFLLLFLVIFFLKESVAVNEKAEFSFSQTIKSYKIVLSNKAFLVYIISASLAMATIFSYITGSAFVFIKFFGLSELQYSIVFAVNALGFAIFANLNTFLLKKYSPQAIIKRAFLTMTFFAFLMIMSAFTKDSFIIFELSIFFTISMLGFIMPNATSLAMSYFKENSGAASAVLGAMQFALAGTIAFIVGAIDANTPLVLACVIFVCTVLATSIYIGFNRLLNNTQHKD